MTLKASPALLKSAVALASALAVVAVPVRAAEDGALPDYLYDRGTGVPTTLFGSYVRQGELKVYTYYEYDRDADHEYKPKELGFKQDKDYFGKFVAHEYLIWFGYGLTDSLLVEFETVPYTTATQWKSKDDTSNMPRRLSESGWGDTEASVVWRALRETESRPEIALGFTTVFPLQKNKVLIGTQEWEFTAGAIVTKGFPFGTLSLRGEFAYDTGDRDLGVGEVGLDYLKRLSPNWRMLLSYEGEEDEQSVIAEAQYRFRPNAVLKLNSGFGVTKKAVDVAPEVGIMWSF